jgi:hypothetical protein
MAFNFDDSGYVDVAERIRQLREKHPEAVLRPANPLEPFKIMEIGGREFIVYTAACYRSPDDPMPAIAVAAEPAIGRTNFTKDSEVMNAETSAWGRAILAALACDSHKVASANEVRNRVADQQGKQEDDSWRDAPAVPRKAANPATNMRAAVGSAATGGKATDKQLGLIKKLAGEVVNGDIVPVLQDLFSYETLEELTSQEASFLISDLMGRK